MQKSYSPQEFEKRIYETWLQNGYFTPKLDNTKRPFSMVMPPPNITGQLHMGHALNNTLQDIIARYRRMTGRNVLWLPGTDHASIATEVKITEKLASEGIDKKALGREGFLKAAYDWNDKYGNRIVEQLQQLGCSCDFSRQAFTMDDKCSKAVLEAFIKYYEKGLIYRGDRMISWCTECKTALSDAEVEHAENEGHLWHIRYPIEGKNNEFLTVATTRPETMLGDTAVAVNPNDSRYKMLIGKNIRLPLTGRVIPIIADEYVDMDFGTGAVKITPSHDTNDFEIGTRHKLPRVEVMDERGIMSENAGDYNGLDRFAARKKIVEDLQSLTLLEKVEPRNNSVGTCYRCSSVIEPRISKQWFVKMKKLAKPAAYAISMGQTRFSPEHFIKTYLHWLNNIKDWCISRQLWWGHRIPAYYCGDCAHMQINKDAVATCQKCGSNNITQDEDVLDTWFSSALWPFSTLGWPDATEDLQFFYPTNLLVTGYDIIFFWVARMMFSSIEFMDKVPFRRVLINGLVRDSEGRKMSKSAGNGIDPLELIEKYGCDALRFSLVHGIASGADQRFSYEKIENSRHFMNKIYNAAKFVIANCDKAEYIDPNHDAYAPALDHLKLSWADKWILTHLGNTIISVRRAFIKLETGMVSSMLYDFTWNYFCDWYIECAKVSLNSDDEATKIATQTTLLYVFKAILSALHPFIPFVTEEIFQNLPGNKDKTIMFEPYPSRTKRHKKHYILQEQLMEVIKAIRNFRSENKIAPSKKIEVLLRGRPIDTYEKLIVERLTVANCNKTTYQDHNNQTQNCIEIILPHTKIYILKTGLTDTATDKERLQKDLKNAEFELSLAQKKLSNPGFSTKAPKNLLDAEKEKVEKYTALIEDLRKAISN